MIQEFKDFINRGNLIDLAVAFVLGVAFTSVVTALTARIISPLIGMVFNLSGLERIGTFGPDNPETGLPTGSVGAFIEALLNFGIVALVLFFVVKAYNSFKARTDEPVEEDAAEAEDIVLLREIRDSLNRQSDR